MKILLNIFHLTFLAVFAFKSFPDGLLLVLRVRHILNVRSFPMQGQQRPAQVLRAARAQSGAQKDADGGLQDFLF